MGSTNGKIFHRYHAISFLTSILAYLYSTFINSSAAKWGFSFIQIGLINLLWSFVYAIASITIGHFGDKYGYKKMIIILYTYMILVSIVGLVTFSPTMLIVFSILQGAFFGTFFPQVEGLIARSEKQIGIDPPSVTGRFTISWSTGNMLGVAFGPYLTVRARSIIFLYGLVVSIAIIMIVYLDSRKYGNLIRFKPVGKLKHKSSYEVLKDVQRMKRLRLEYRIILLLGGIVYTAVLADFPKLISLAGIGLQNAGFLTVGANIGVLITFLCLQFWRGWVGKEGLSALLLSVIPLSGIVAFFAKTPLMFFITAFVAGCSYAVPYTFAIFYGLLSEEEGQGKQGAIHEMVIGLLFGIGPFLGGIFLDKVNSVVGLTILALLIGAVTYGIQMAFNFSNKGRAVVR